MSFWRDSVIQPALDHDVDEAVAQQQALLRQDPHNAKAHAALGTLLHFRGDTERAITCFERAIRYDPGNSAAHVSLGRILVVQGRLGEAKHHACEAARLGDRSLLDQLDRYPNVR